MRLFSMYRWVRERHMIGIRGRNFLEAPWAGGVVLLGCVIVAMLLANLPLLEEFIDVVLEGGCTQLWIDVKTLGDEAGGNAEASRTGIAAAQIVHEKRAKNFVGFIVGRLAIRDKVIPAVRSAWPVSYGAAAYEPGDFIARDIPWANMKLADFGLDTKRAKSFPENKVRLSLWQIDTDEQMQWYQGIRSDVYGI